MPLVLIAAVPALACGPSPAPAVPATAASPGDDEWRAACAGGAAGRLERFRAVALLDAAARGDEAARAALERWRPRGRDAGPAATAVSAADRVVVLDVVRRWIGACGLDETISLTTTLVGFQTVFDVAPPPENPEFLALADFLERWSRDAGLGFRLHGDHDAYEVILPGAEEQRVLALIAHADVVPVGDPPAIVDPDAVPAGWSGPPYRAWIADGRLWGRGTEDDKGPIAAALVVLSALADAGLTPDGPVVLVAGNGEESDWSGMQRYAAEAPAARNYVSIDAEFPVVFGEDGFVAWGIRVPLGDATADRSRPAALHVEGGLFLTQIPGLAGLWLRPGDEGEEALRARARAASSERVAALGEGAGFGAEVEIAERGGAPAVVVRARGRSGHSSVPETAANALWLLAEIARTLDLAPGGIRTMLEILADEFAGDHRGTRLGLAYEDPRLGPLVVAATVLRIEDGEVRLSVNMRRPPGRSQDEFMVMLDGALAGLRERHGGDIAVVDDVFVGSAHETDPDAPLVRTLLDVYRSVTGDAGAVPVALRGGTYARLFPGAVSFGPCLPGEPYRGHGADEYIGLDALDATVRLVFEAVVRLAFVP